MTTPLFDAVEQCRKNGYSRFHMPGHKGAAMPPVGVAASFDITEIPGCGSLYEAAGNDPIAQTERRYTELYGSKGSFLSAGGSTLCIQAMLALAVPIGGKLIAVRGVHASAVNAMALLGHRPVWLMPHQNEQTGLAEPVTPQEVADALEQHPDAAAVYVTSPTYYGVLSDIAGLADVCHKKGIPLLVDNAHGAHLKFLPQSLHPLDAGADLCCDSLHKTLPVLTGGAILHVGNPRFLPQVKARMALFGSTSPSYLIMLSLDCALDYLYGAASADIADTLQRLASLRRMAVECGFSVPDGVCDPMRLTLGFYTKGYTRDAFLEHLHQCKIEPEYIDEAYCVFLAGGANTDEDYLRLEQALTGAEELSGTVARFEGFTHVPEQAVSLREAVFSPCETVSAADAVGRIAGSGVSPCPPGIPVVLPGERIDAAVAGVLERTGVSGVNVLK